MIYQALNILKKNYPNPKTELNYRNEFELLIASMLSPRTTDKKVNEVTNKLFGLVSNYQDLIDMGPQTILSYIKEVGLSNRKSQYIYHTCLTIRDNHCGKIPQNFTELTKLPGIGPKVANFLLNTLFKQPTIAVDTHVYRVAKRIGIKGNNHSQVEAKLHQKLPKTLISDVSNILVLHGRYVCKSLKPRCDKCSLSQLGLCQYYNKSVTKLKKSSRLHESGLCDSKQ